MPTRRTFMDQMRQQVAADTEDPIIRVIRRNAAGISVVGGLVALAFTVPIVAGDISWAAIPGILLLLSGAIYGIRSFFDDYVPESRRCGKWAAIHSATGLAEILIVGALT